MKIKECVIACLISEHDSHKGDEKTEETLQLTQAISIQEQECEGVSYGDDNTSVQWYSANDNNGNKNCFSNTQV